MPGLSKSLGNRSSLLKDFDAVASVPGSGRRSKFGASRSEGSLRDCFAALIRSFRGRLNLNRKDASSRIGVSEAALASWERMERTPRKNPVPSIAKAYRLNYIEETRLLSAWKSDRESVSRFMGRVISLSQTGIKRPGRSRISTEDERREDTRLRVQRFRDRAKLGKLGLLDGTSLNMRGRLLLEKAVAHYPDPSLTPELEKLLVRFESNRPRKQYGRLKRP